MDRWTSEELEYIKNNYSSMRTKEISIKLNRTPEAIYKKARKLDLLKKDYVIPEGFGHCSQCGKILPEKSFYKHHIGKRCIDCSKEYNNARYKEKVRKKLKDSNARTSL